MLNFRKRNDSLFLCLTVFLGVILISSPFNAQIQEIEEPKNTSFNFKNRDEFTHTVFAEECSATWCGFCPPVINFLHNIWEDENYDWYYVTLVDDKNTHADQRISELGVTGFPTVVYDGGYTEIVGATNQQDHENAIQNCGDRTDVANIDLSLTAYWLGNGEINVTAEITNNEASTYNGHLHVYVTEINSRWNNGGTQYHFAMINNYAINQNVQVASGVTETITQTWSGYTDISMNNIKVIGSVFDQTTDYTDETAGTDPVEQNVDPVANFTFSPETPDTSQTIQFNDNSSDPDGNINSWYWAFGDGDSSSEQNPTHRYNDDGLYSVTLTVTDDDGNTDETSRDIVVSNVAPLSDFTYTPTNPTDEDTIYFTDLSSDSDGNIVSWNWEFDDGSTSTVQNPTHEYDTDGEYTVTLLVTDNDGAIDSISQTINVLNYGPNADFSITPKNPTTEDTVQFTDESFDTTGDNIDSWYWEFGDGSTSTVQNPTHSYATNGSYQVNLTVTNSSTRASHTSSKIIYIGMVNFETTLDTGWNMIGVPVTNVDFASELADNISGCQSVSKWDSVNQTYYTYIPGIPSFDFPLVDGFGYFVDVDEQSVLSLVGPPVIDVSVSLDVGWNMIGWYKIENTSASSLAENISGCQGISKWDSVNQTFYTYIPGVPSFDFVVTPGMGLFVDVTTESTWYGTG